MFAYYERTSILPKFKNNLLIYLRFIDNIFIVWKDSTSSSTSAQIYFNSFKKYLNDKCNLTWLTEDRCERTTFLDLTVKIDKTNGKFATTTFQKACNLFPYIPAHSSHPPGQIKSLVFGLLQTYWQQNTIKQDYITMVNALYKRLTVRGYDDQNILHVFK